MAAAGPDGRGGDQPRGTVVTHNVAHEIGLFEKQSSFYFQAVSAQANISNNVVFNGPRAMLNFNDGFGGGDIIGYNLLANAVRESGDHGPVSTFPLSLVRLNGVVFLLALPKLRSTTNTLCRPWNSWDRVPYITELRYGNGTGSIRPLDRLLHHNFILGTYNTQECIDTDDGSSNYQATSNVFVYGHNGLKSNFGGNSNRHRGNLYAYVDGCFYNNPCRTCSTNATLSDDAFTNNTCVFKDPAGYLSTCGAYTAPLEVHGNRVFGPNNATVCGGQQPLSAWLAKGHDRGTSFGPYPSDATIMAWARELLGF